MRRTDKEITGRAELDEIIARALVCRLAMCSEGVPYIVPLCFGYDGAHFYFHSANEGKKIELLRKNNRVSFELEVDIDVVRGPKACSNSMRYRSVVGQGTAVFVEEEGAKRSALDAILKQYGHEGGAREEVDVSGITIIRLDVAEMTGKKSKL